MWQEELARVWGGLTKEALQEVTDWRWEHPKATLKEIEELVDGSLARVRARLLQEVALASDARELVGRRMAAEPSAQSAAICCKASLRPPSGRATATNRRGHG